MGRAVSVCLLCLVSWCGLRIAHASDPSVPWNPRVKPRVDRARALRLAQKALGRDAGSLRCQTDELVGLNEKGTAGEWRLVYVDRRGLPRKEVVVRFANDRPSVSVQVHGPMAR